MGLSNKYESLPYSTRQCFTWNNFTQTKTPKHQKYTGNNKNKYLAKHIPKPHPGIKSTMLRPQKKHTSPDNYYYPSKIETKFNLEQLYWKFCLPFIFVNENLLETKQPRQCFTWNKFTASQRKQTKHTYPTFIT